MMKKLLIGAGAAAFLSLAAASIHAEATAEQIASLGAAGSLQSAPGLPSLSGAEI